MQTAPKKPARSKAKSASNAKVTSQSIAEHTRAFLQAGGKIIKLRSGEREECRAEKE